MINGNQWTIDKLPVTANFSTTESANFSMEILPYLKHVFKFHLSLFYRFLSILIGFRISSVIRVRTRKAELIKSGIIMVMF